LKNAFVFLLLTLCAAAGAQAPVPVSEEPRHRVVFENAYVRVIDALVPPGEVTLFHTHTRDNVPVAISGGRLRTEIAGSETRDSEVETGAAWFARGGYTHRIENIGATPARFLDAELLDASPPVAVAGVPELAAHVLEVENERVRIYRVVIHPGDAVGPHTHVLPWLGVAVRPSLSADTGERAGVRGHASPSSGAESGTSSQSATRTPLPFEWHEAGRAEPYRADAGAAREWVEIEWKD
jgi:quercetin dioxygenase-like cupin family protein